MKDRAILLLILAAGATAGSASAQLADPTRPANAQFDAATPGAAASVESGVQTVILRRDGKSAAVINGRHVVVGDKLGDKRIIRISESEVVLTGDSGREVIKVTPAIEKKPAKPPAAAKPRTRRTTEGTGEK